MLAILRSNLGFVSLNKYSAIAIDNSSKPHSLRKIFVPVSPEINRIKIPIKRELPKIKKRMSILESRSIFFKKQSNKYKIAR